MNRSWNCWILGILTLCFHFPCLAQVGGDAATRPPEAVIWRIFGRVLTVGGDPLPDVVVQLDAGPTGELRRSMKTNLQGEFQVDLRSDPASSVPSRGTVVASKTGYVEGRETFDFGSDEKSSGIEIVLREIIEGPDQLSIGTLVDALAPKLRDDAAKIFVEESVRTEFLRGCEDLIDHLNAVTTASGLKSAAERMPTCLECRVLTSLALLNTGSWSSAEKELEHALKADDGTAVKRSEPAVVLGVLQAWRGQNNEAVRSYLRALEADPQNALALQELGRSLVALKHWEAADQYLEKALEAGAGDGARLLRVRSLLELGDIAEAAHEMDLYAAGRKVKDLPLVARSLSSGVQDHLALLSYEQVKSVTVQSPEELTRALPDLQGLKAATDQSLLQEVLQKTGLGVEAFFKNFPNTVSLEQVRQERLGKDGRIKDSLNQEFQYLLLTHAEEAGLGIEEHRSTAEGQEAALVGLHKGLMLTSGFASASSLFHPVNRSGADFRYLGKQEIDGQEAYVVAFAQKPETAKMVTRFVTDKDTALILVQGVAWVDCGTFHIIRLHTGLLNPLPKVRLQKQTTEIKFQPVSFDGSSTTLWLPREVEVMIEWKGRVLRNQHRYSDFKLFNVEVQEVGIPRQKSPGKTPTQP